MTEAGRAYAGMDRFDCREQIVEDLNKAGLLEKVEPYRARRPLLPLQDGDRAAALQAVVRGGEAPGRDGHRGGGGRPHQIRPANWEKTYFDWMDNIRDWCISRQIWWGHRIPAWYCEDCGEVIVSREDPTPAPSAAARAGPGDRRPGHLVLLGPVALLHPGLARRRPRS